MMPVEIGAASSTELPLTEHETLPGRQPETLKLNDSQSTVPPETIFGGGNGRETPESRPKIETKIERKRIARVKKKPPAKPAAKPASRFAVDDLWRSSGAATSSCLRNRAFHVTHSGRMRGCASAGSVSLTLDRSSEAMRRPAFGSTSASMPLRFAA